MLFEDRKQAGKLLAGQLIQYKDQKPIILALPRGGVPVAFEVAKVLHAPLDIIVSRKIGALHDPEFGIGAISEEGTQVLDNSSIELLKISKEELDRIIQTENRELKRRVVLYRKGKPLSSIKDKTVILVDDGLATGVTAHAAIAAIKKHKPKQIILACPVCAHDIEKDIEKLVDKIICIITPMNLSAIGCWYRNFEQVDDEKVMEFLKQNKGR